MPRRYFVLQSALYYGPIGSKLTIFVGNLWRLLAVKFKENPSNVSREASENVLYSPSKVPCSMGRSKSVSHLHGMRGKYRE
jgi:hypothetical protein